GPPQPRLRSRLGAAAIRLGFIYVHGVGEVYAEQVERVRGQQAFASLQDFCQRTRLPRRAIENLIMVGAFDALRKARRQLLWDLGLIDYEEDTLVLQFPDDDVTLPPLTKVERVLTEYNLLGVAVSQHPMTLYARWRKRESVLSAR